MAQRTDRIWLRDSYTIRQYSHLAKNLYNHANYIYKLQAGMYPHFPVTKKHYTSAFELMDILRNHPNYTALPGHTAQQIIKFMIKAWKSFWNAIKEYKKHPEKFEAPPQPPKMLRKDGFHVLYFTDNQVRIKDGYIIFPKRIGLKVKTRLNVKIKHARIIPKHKSFVLEVIYDKEVPAPPSQSLRIIAVDFGLNNLITAVSNVQPPLIIKGTPIKSYNQGFNKEQARLTSIYALQNPDLDYVPYGSKLLELLDKRYKKMEDFLHKVSRVFINYCIDNLIDTIVIGYNEGWKQNINIGKKNNQNFVNIPYLTLLEKIEYKAEDAGILVIRQEESYTSKCSFLDNEVIDKHATYVGTRLKRGLFQSAKGILINADCNGAGNIGRKVFPMFNYGIVDVVSHPIILNVFR